MLNKKQLERYNRNILVSEIDIEGQDKLLNAKVLVCGAGGLGSSVLVNLSSLGIGHIGIIDNDIIELSNLNRQFIHKQEALGQIKVNSAKKWVEEFNSDISVETFKISLDSQNYRNIVKDYDIIVDCFDSFKSKFLLNNIALDMKKSLVHGGVCEFRGQVMTVIPGKTACLKCAFPQDEQEYIVKGVASPSVSIIGSIQSMEVLKLILEQGELLTDKMLVFDALRMNFKTININSKGCKCNCNYACVKCLCK